MQNRNGATKDDNILPLINEKIQQTLLVPSNTYLETENVTNKDEFEVKTYFFKSKLYKIFFHNFFF